MCLFQDGPVDMSLAVLAAGGSAAGDEGAALDEDDAAIYKKRIADLLLPGETVLLALRRLGGWHTLRPCFTLLLARRLFWPPCLTLSVFNKSFPYCAGVKFK